MTGIYLQINEPLATMPCLPIVQRQSFGPENFLSRKMWWWHPQYVHTSNTVATSKTILDPPTSIPILLTTEFPQLVSPSHHTNQATFFSRSSSSSKSMASWWWAAAPYPTGHAAVGGLGGLVERCFVAKVCLKGSCFLHILLPKMLWSMETSFGIVLKQSIPWVKRWKNSDGNPKYYLFTKADLRGCWIWNHVNWGVVEAEVIWIAGKVQFSNTHMSKGSWSWGGIWEAPSIKGCGGWISSFSSPRLTYVSCIFAVGCYHELSS